MYNARHYLNNIPTFFLTKCITFYRSRKLYNTVLTFAGFLLIFILTGQMTILGDIFDQISLNLFSKTCLYRFLGKPESCSNQMSRPVPNSSLYKVIWKFLNKPIVAYSGYRTHYLVPNICIYSTIDLV
jgi:hypothetical protein